MFGPPSDMQHETNTVDQSAEAINSDRVESAWLNFNPPLHGDIACANSEVGARQLKKTPSGSSFLVIFAILFRPSHGTGACLKNDLLADLHRVPDFGLSSPSPRRVGNDKYQGHRDVSSG